ncbi:MAG: hypothetical protein JO210_04105, partial [Acidobacteriaceae bacterium]|nr:hypothetical protein [Acidobacteriaceae bacterium]
MQPIILALVGLSDSALSMCAAGLAMTAIGLSAAKIKFAGARGIDKIIVLTPVCFAIPLAVFGAEHFSSSQ